MKATGHFDERPPSRYFKTLKWHVFRIFLPSLGRCATCAPGGNLSYRAGYFSISCRLNTNSARYVEISAPPPLPRLVGLLAVVNFKLIFMFIWYCRQTYSCKVHVIKFGQFKKQKSKFTWLAKRKFLYRYRVISFSLFRVVCKPILKCFYTHKWLYMTRSASK